jgi:hypothetical protein
MMNLVKANKTEKATKILLNRYKISLSFDQLLFQLDLVFVYLICIGCEDADIMVENVRNSIVIGIFKLFV